VQYIGTSRDNYFGQCDFSPDGKRFAYYDHSGDLDLMDFDRCQGIFSNLTHIDFNDSAGCGGVAFSPSSNVLYVSSMKFIYQFDLLAANIPLSQTTVAVWDGYYSPQFPNATLFSLCQFAPDGKIYISCGNETMDYHVINSPEIIGLNCDVCQHCVNMQAYSSFTIPNYPNYFLGAEIGSSCDTLTQVESLPNSLNFKIYPNPVTTNWIACTYSTTSEEGEKKILNVDGKVMANYSIPAWTHIKHLNLPNLINGIYSGTLKTKNSFCTFKFIKVKE